MRKQNRFRALRNLTGAAVMFLFIWYLRGCPLPTAEMELPRSERQHLLSESRAVWEYSGTYGSDRAMMVAVADDHVSAYLERGRCWFLERRGDEPTVVLLPSNTRYNLKAHSLLAPAFVAVDVPARAHSAKLHVLLSYNEWEQVYTAEGEKQDGAWFFQLKEQYSYLENGYSAADEELESKERNAFSLLRMAGQSSGYSEPCTLELFDREGNCFARVDTNGGVPTVTDMAIVR